ncbi:short-chain dehydrogenase/reductase [Trichophyton tonsurans CBS 112818]|uniref:Short-chain dehydrogenase/reductase n=1 Tax=Trichophyton tonsurans (strain CBS 112818) TaxID=647933 RepID=F2SA62_TRIT1|nr:short-chain dehydrogenase/reductase [Trichophyton tonsurans CBS 112818]
MPSTKQRSGAPLSAHKPSHPAVTFDILVNVFRKTLFHPFIAWLIPLCLVAQATPYSHPSFLITAAYAICLSTFVVLSYINKRLAYGLPRNVDFKKEVIAVAGGASGLGLAIAETYAMRGVSVAVLDIKDPADDGGYVRWDEFPSLEYYKCDMSSKNEVEEVVKKIVKDLGRPTVFVNCVATAINGLPLLFLSDQAIETTIKTNILSHFHALKAFLPGMLSSRIGGTIVTVSSVLGHITAAGLSDYAASKAAVTAVHRTVDAEIRVLGASKKIKTILVETGQIATPLFEGLETPNSFWAPVLEPVQVAREIISMIDSGNGGVIRMPAYATFLGVYAMLPASIERLARYLSGVDSAVAKATISAAAENREHAAVSLSTSSSEDSDDDDSDN